MGFFGGWGCKGGEGGSFQRSVFSFQSLSPLACGCAMGVTRVQIGRGDLISEF